MKKLDGKSMDIVAENVDKLKELFPEAFTEDGTTENTEGHGKIDFEVLKELLGEYVSGQDERYSFTWNGKSKARMIAQTPSTGTLRPCKEESVDWESTQNIFIEGDNLEVLKLLQKSYHKKVKMIYIDPPYNTGNDFVYKDNFKDNIKNYKEITGQVDGEGRNLSNNPETSGRYHTDWLNMMYPRLKLARNLLKDDGVIFISIDDNEVSNLRKMCDEVFGEENFLANVIWHKRYAASNDAKGIPSMHDHILVYQKSSEFNRYLLPRTEKQDSLYKYDSNDGKGRWRPDNLTVKTISESYLYEIVNPNTGKSYPPSQGRCWLTNENTMQEWIKEGRVFFGQKGDGAPQLKRYLSEVQNGVIPNTYWSYDEVGHTDSSRKELKKLFKTSAPFDNPKPIGLLIRILQIAINKDELVLDFFAGSATTAHAVMQLNAEDGGNRKFIMVQLPEPCDEKTEAFKAGYKTIAEISKERIRRAAAKIKEELTTTEHTEHTEKESKSSVSSVPSVVKKIDLAAAKIKEELTTTEYTEHTEKESKSSVSSVPSVVKKIDLAAAKIKEELTTTEHTEHTEKESKSSVSSVSSVVKKIDLGFKVFKLDSTNIKPWEVDFDMTGKTLEDYISNIKTERREEDVLYEVLLKYGLDLTLPITQRSIAGKKVFDIGMGALIICLADSISLEVVEGIGKLKEELNPEIMRVVFKDASFQDDVVKTNAVQILRTAGIVDVRSL